MMVSMIILKKDYKVYVNYFSLKYKSQALIAGFIWFEVIGLNREVSYHKYQIYFDMLMSNLFLINLQREALNS